MRKSSVRAASGGQQRLDLPELHIFKTDRSRAKNDILKADPHQFSQLDMSGKAL